MVLHGLMDQISHISVEIAVGIFIIRKGVL